MHARFLIGLSSLWLLTGLPLEADPLGAPAPSGAIQTEGDAAGRRWHPNRILVKFKGPAAEAADEIFDRKAKFADGGAPTLDGLFGRYRVSRCTPVFSALARKMKATGKTERWLLQEAFAKRHPGRAIPALPERHLRRHHAVEISEENSAERAVEDFRNDVNVESAELDYERHITVVPNDPMFASLWGLSKIQAPQAWDLSTGSATVVVAVIDTGVDRNHPDLATNVWHNLNETGGNGIDDDGNGYVDDVYGWDFANGDNDPMDGHFHGTHVSGTIGGVGNNGQGVVGVNWNVRIMAVKGLSDSGSGFTSALADCVYYAADNGADVTSNSWGGPGSSPVLEDAFDYARSLGVTSIAAAGNSNSDAADFNPANIASVIAVSALDSNDVKASFSNWGEKILVGAPGVGILSTVLNGQYGTASGTSMACPHVAGLAALMLSRNYDLTPAQIEFLLATSADDVGSPGFDLHSGYGRINAFRALQQAGSGQVPPNPVLPIASIREPAHGSFLGGPETTDVAVSGSATTSQGGAGMTDYTLELGPGENPQTWILIRQSTVPVPSGTLGTFSKSQLVPISRNTLRLTVRTADNLQLTVLSQFTYDPRPQPVASITFPADGQTVGGAADTDVVVQGTATTNLGGQGMTEYSLEIGPGENPQTWTQVRRSTTPVPSGTLGSFSKSLLAPYAHNSIRLTVQTVDGLQMSAVSVITYDPRLLAAWNNGYVSTPSEVRIADLDLDGTGEIIWAPDTTNVWVMDYAGNAKPGWPVAAGSIVGYHVPYPSVADIDADPQLELLLPRNHLLAAYNHDGTIVPGFPWNMNVHQPQPHVSMRPGASVAVADLQGDGSLEFVVAWESLLYYNGDYSNGDRAYETQVFVLDAASGQVLPGWPKTLRLDATFSGGNQNWQGEWANRKGPAVGDLDGDGKLEIVFCAETRAGAYETYGSKLYAWRHDGSPIAGWPAANIPFGLTSPTIGDADDDGDREILLARGDGIWIWEHTGRLQQIKSVFPVQMINQQPTTVVEPWRGTVSFGSMAGTRSYAMGGTRRNLTGVPAPRFALCTPDGGASTFHYLAVNVGESLSGRGTLEWPDTWQIFREDLWADVTGDGQSEIIANEMFWTHALTRSGTEITDVAEFPKAAVWFDGTTVLNRTTPAVGDLTGDGKFELVVVSEFGAFSVWSTEGIGTPDWPCWGGNLRNTRTYAPAPPAGSPVLKAVIVSPPSIAALAPGATLQFSAQGYDQFGRPISAPFLWNATGGSIGSSGLYTAPGAVGTYTVTASSGAVSGSSIVVVGNAAVAIEVSPSGILLQNGAQQQFTATARDAQGNPIPVSIAWSATQGSISPTGLYTAAGSGTQIVRASNGAVSGAAAVTLVNNPPATPAAPSGPVEVTQFETATYQASTTDPNGDNIRYIFEWDGGTTATGYVASGAAASASHVFTFWGTSLIRVRAEDMTGASSGWSPWLAVTVNPSRLASIAVKPVWLPVPRGYARSFTVSGFDSLGNPHPTGTVSWSATGGTINAAGLFTAPATGGTFTVTATATGPNGPVTATATARVPTTVRRADWNGDGGVNILDLNFATDRLFRGGPPPAYLQNGDYNLDNAINILDHSMLVNYLFRGGPPPATYSGPGTPLDANGQIITGQAVLSK